MGIVVVFGIGIGLYIGGAHYFGVLLCLFAAMMFSIIVTEILFNFVFNRKIRATRIFISLIATILIFGIGTSIAALEVAESSYTNTIPGGYQIQTMTKEFNDKEVQGYITYSGYYHKLRVVEDNSLKDTIRVEVNYYEEFSNPVIELYNSHIEISSDNTRIRGNTLYKLIKNDLKEKSFHNYTNLFEPEVTIYANKATIERMDAYFQKQLQDELEGVMDTLRDEIDNLRDEIFRITEDRDEWRDKYYDRGY